MEADQLIRQAAIQIPEADLRDIVRRIVEVADPEKIILFGSAARGTMGPNSDLDLLVIKGGDYDHSRVSRDIYRSLRDIDYAKDVLLFTPEEVERYRDCFALVIYPALREGIVIYDRATA
jgi:predicted nucleotidyltransferase